MLDCSVRGVLCGEVCWTAVCVEFCVERYVGLHKKSLVMMSGTSLSTSVSIVYVLCARENVCFFTYFM